jgi:peroxiredoxin
MAMAMTVALAAAPAGGASLPKRGFIETSGSVRVGQPVPPFTAVDLDGKPVSAATLKGRPVLLDFGSIFCGFCQETIAEFKRLEDAYRETDLALVVVVDGLAPVPTLKNYFGHLKAHYPVIRDADQSLSKLFGVETIPFQVSIDRQGIVRKMHVGFNPQLEQAMELYRLVQ